MHVSGIKGASEWSDFEILFALSTVDYQGAVTLLVGYCVLCV